MIELVSESLCTKCNLCVAVCPTNVFDKVEQGIPEIARQSDCQTCFMCELYCPVDALYVSPNAEQSVLVNESELLTDGVLGSYRATIGWTPGKERDVRKDESYKMHQAVSRAEGMPTAVRPSSQN